MPISEEARERDERRLMATAAMDAVIRAVKDTNPATLFFIEKKAAGIDDSQERQINQRWAQGAADLIETAQGLAQAVGADALNLFKDATRADGQTAPEVHA
jgi:hypothetical protein